MKTPRFHWPDRRPLAADWLSSSEPRFHSPTNPRGWLCRPDLDITTDAGRAYFHQELLARADQTLVRMRTANAQGIVIWDIEGQEFPHYTSYVGDPRSLPPEIDSVADQYFARFTGAGYRVGVCLRPTLPCRSLYDNDARQELAIDPAALVSAKISYARQRWGVTLIYLDSNGPPYPVEWIVALRRAHPECLLIPEHETVGYYAHCAPYTHVAANGYCSTSAAVRRLFPTAFGVFQVSAADLEQKRAELVASVRGRDVLLYVGWPGDDAAAVADICERVRADA